jgi:son of sevenless-like protein
VTTERERERIDRQAEMLARIASERLPDQWLQTKAQEIAPWYLRPEHRSQSEIVLNPDGGVRAATLPALIERLTMHDGSGAFPLPFHACLAMQWG